MAASVPQTIGDPPPDIVARTMNAWQTGESVEAINEDWRRGVEARRPFNETIRRRARGKFSGTIDGCDQARDAQTGQYVDLGEQMRSAGSQPVPGGIVPRERAATPVDPFRAAYELLLDRRAQERAA